MGDTHDDSGKASATRSVSYVPHLVVLLECDRPLAGGARYSLEGVDRVTIGRGSAQRVALRNQGSVVTLDLRLPGRSLSANHARLVQVGSAWAIEDLGSTNGTLVNGKRVARHVLGPNDLFEVGHTHMRVNLSVPTRPDAPLDVDIEGPASDALATLDPALAIRFESLATIAPSDVPVLILGESGTGKELVARWVHARTGRTGDFVAVNCGAIPSALVESSLFGHVKGAFSGALRDELGFVRAAHGGTLFLDEIADLRTESQAALLRVLQEREVVPVGATRPVPVDLRLIAATHRAVDELIARGEFRRDLFARIAGFTIRLPPLRKRLDDSGLLVAAILRRIAADRTVNITLESEVGRAILAYEWPLNVRELEQCLSTCVALAKDGRIVAAHLPAHVLPALDPVAAPLASAGRLNERDAALRLELLAQLERHSGNLADVARAMGRARMQVHRWCRRFGIDPNVNRKP
jgi:sigma-54 dependent transcriptional regulator, acetoin dehydrogenase operon transcriptional activator AcoR